VACVGTVDDAVDLETRGAASRASGIAGRRCRVGPLLLPGASASRRRALTGASAGRRLRVQHEVDDRADDSGDQHEPRGEESHIGCLHRVSPNLIDGCPPSSRFSPGPPLRPFEHFLQTAIWGGASRDPGRAGPRPDRRTRRDGGADALDRGVALAESRRGAGHHQEVRGRRIALRRLPGELQGLRVQIRGRAPPRRGRRASVRGGSSTPSLASGLSQQP